MWANRDWVGRYFPANLPSGDELVAYARWATTVAGWISDGLRPIFFVHTPDNVASLDLCRQFHDEVDALVENLEPLPDPHEPLPGDQLGLFE